MMFMILGIGLFLLPILFRLALKLRLGIPMLYAVLMLTAFHGWYQAHTILADGIFFAMAGLAALSWVVTLLRRLWELLENWREECYVPTVSSRQSYEEWSVTGRRNIVEIAGDRMRTLLENHQAPALSAEKEQALEDILNDARNYYRRSGEISEEEWKSLPSLVII